MLTITWHDGTTDTAPDADAMLERLGNKQMDRSVDIRVALSKRALYWSGGGTMIDPTADALDILLGMQKAGMLSAVEVDNAGTLSL